MSDKLQRIRQRTGPRDIELSIGTVTIRPVKLESLVMAKRIPLTLVKKMEGMKRTAAGGFRIEDAIEMTEAIDAVVIAAMVDPLVTPDGGEDTLGILEIPFEDRVLIFTEANAPAAAYANFPGGQPAGGTAGHDGEDVRPPAE